MRAVTPRERGASAARRGKLLKDNPFTNETSAQSKKFMEWLRGFADQAQAEADEMRRKA